MARASCPIFSVDRYLAVEKLATGGMATVYRGQLEGEGGFSKLVVLKKMHPHIAADPAVADAFLREARVGSCVRHAGVLPILDVLRDGDDLVLVTEYVEGVNVEELRRDVGAAEGVLPLDVVSAIVAGMLAGLHAAHEARGDDDKALGIVHLDVSPTNVLVGRDGVVRILDFGIARVLGDLADQPDERIVGKPAYLAPEQILRRTPSRRTDIWAASVILWELLTGERLFSGGTVETVLMSVVSGRPTRPSTRRPEISKELDALVLRGLSRDPEKRWATAAEMAQALETAVAPASARAVGDRVARVADDVKKRVALEKTTVVEELSSDVAAIASRVAGLTLTDSRPALEDPAFAAITVRDLTEVAGAIESEPTVTPEDPPEEPRPEAPAEDAPTPATSAEPVVFVAPLAEPPPRRPWAVVVAVPLLAQIAIGASLVARAMAADPAAEAPPLAAARSPESALEGAPAPAESGTTEAAVAPPAPERSAALPVPSAAPTETKKAAAKTKAPRKPKPPKRTTGGAGLYSRD